MAIEVVKYVRTKKYGICELLYDTNDGYSRFCDDTGRGVFLGEDDIVNHNKNIIELVEVGDYVNGNLITSIYDENKEDEQIQFEINHQGNYRYYTNEDIETILTKEQYEQYAYKVEE